MGRHPCCVKQKLRKGLWSPEEDEKLFNYITRFGVGCWSSVPKLAGLQRCGKSCRLRWINYLRPDLKRGMFSQEEEDLIISLHKALGNRWAQIATQLPGRTDNEIKNFWNSCLKKKLIKQGIDPNTHMPLAEIEVKKEKESLDSASLHNLQTNGLPNLSNPVEIDQQDYHLICGDEEQMQFQLQMQSSRDNLVTKQQVYDPIFLFDFQAAIDPNGYHSTFLSHCQKNLVRPYEQDLVAGNSIINSNCGFNSMPNLTTFDHQNNTDYSDCSTPRISTFLLNEAKESSSKNNMIENASAFSWDSENKLESMFQFQFTGIQIEDRKASLFQNHQHSGDFCNYPLASLSQELAGENLDVFQQL